MKIIFERLGLSKPDEPLAQSLTISTVKYSIKAVNKPVVPVQFTMPLHCTHFKCKNFNREMLTC